MSIERTARRLRWAVLMAWGLLVLAYVAGRFEVAIGGLSFQTHPDSRGADGHPLIGDLSMVLLTVALVRLAQMLSAISESRYFAVAAVEAFRGFAFWLFLVSLLWVAGPIGTELLRGAEGRPQSYAFRLDLSDLLTVAITLTLFLVARLLERARLIEQDMQEII